jgi:prolyl-tRNA synthetase
MGGKISHEYHFLTSIGEDSIVSCTLCGIAVNKELMNNEKICEKCTPACIENHHGIEIGHTFILEDRYSKALKATFLNKNAKAEVLQMGCYGIGVTRLIAASIEVLSSEKEIRWPLAIAPYNICIIPPKEGSKEETIVKNLANELSESIISAAPRLEDEILIDDRVQMTIGKRLMEMKKLGLSFIIVIGGKSVDSIVEVHDINNNSMQEMNVSDAINFVIKQLN